MTVYVTPTGERWHINPHCNGGTYSPTTLKQAVAKHLTPCENCVRDNVSYYVSNPGQPGAPSTFGDYSSDDGRPVNFGFYDIIDAVQYATPGTDNGVDGGPATVGAENNNRRAPAWNAGEKSTAAFSAIDDLLTGLQVPVYKRFISNKAFLLHAPSGGKLDDFHVASSMAGQAVYVALIAPFYVAPEGENRRVAVDPEPLIVTATVANDGSVSASFSLSSRDYYIAVTTTDLAAHYAGEHKSDAIALEKVLFTCRYTRNTGVFMGLDDIPPVSMADFADKLGYSLRYEQITGITPEAVATTTRDAVYLYSGSEYYELAAIKPSEIPNQSAVYYRCLYQRKEL